MLRTTVVCDRCGNTPVVYADATAPEHMKDNGYCERCAQHEGMERRGERGALVQMLGRVIESLKATGVSDDQVLAAVGSILANPDEIGLAPAPGEAIVCPGRDYYSQGDQPWMMDVFAPIGETS